MSGREGGRRTARGRRVTAVLCLAEVLGMAGFGTYAALLPTLRQAWALSNTEAGLIGGAFFGGYMVAVPFLSSLTDRVDGRRVYLAGASLSAVGAMAFGLAARRLEHGVAFQVVAGAGLAGTYMPGLKILADHLEGAGRSRSVAFYTSSFGIGASLSLLLAAATAEAGGWRAAFLAAGLGPVLAGLIVMTLVPPPPLARAATGGDLILPRGVFRRPVLGYVLGYAAHCWELFGFRSWMVALLAFSASVQGPGREPPLSPPVLAGVVNLLGPPASVAGNELGLRLGVARFAPTTMVLSALLGCLVALLARQAWYALAFAVCFYFVAIMADSAALTSAMVDSADRAQRGATMAFHSFLGFGAALVAPIVFGAALDAGGGAGEGRAWVLAFAVLGGIGATGALALAALTRGARA